MVTDKLCPKCKATYPATSQYWYKNRTKPDGLNVHCKQCERVKDKIRWAKGAEERAKKPRNYKGRIATKVFCPSCKQTLTKGSFYKDLSSPRGIRPHCKNCINKAAAILRRVKASV